MTKHVLFVTDRAFIPPYDGTSNAYLSWLNLLCSGGYRVSAISFNFPRVQWTEESIVKLREMSENVLILNVYRSYFDAALKQLAIVLWRLLSGRRFLPRTLEYFWRRQQRTAIREFLEAHEFDTVIVSKTQTTALIGVDNLNSLTARKIIDMHDNFPRRERLTRRALFKIASRHLKMLPLLLRTEQIRALCNWASEPMMLREEIEILSAYDQVLFYASEEAVAFVNAGLPSARVSTLPWICPVRADFFKRVDCAASNFDVGIIASSAIFNIEGVEYFAREIMPALAERGLRPSVLIAGGVAKYTKQFFNPESRVQFVEWLEDVSTFYSQIGCVAVPLLSGTGISIKTLEAASYGVPIVSTTVGVRGVAVRPDVDVLLGDSTRTFVDALVRLLTDANLRMRLRRSVRDRIMSTHSQSEILDRIKSIL